MDAELKRVASAVLCAAACSTTPAPTAPSPVSAVEPPAMVTDRAGASAAVGTAARVEGTARDAKLAAAIMLGDRTPIYCLGVDSWPGDVIGKRVVATGKLEHTDEFVAAGDAAGTSGAVWVLRDCRYESR